MTGVDEKGCEPPPVASHVRHPWRSTARTTMVAGLALIPVLPDVANALGIQEIPWVARALVVAAAIARVMAIPEVERWIHRWIPWLAAEPYEGKHRTKEKQ